LTSPQRTTLRKVNLRHSPRPREQARGCLPVLSRRARRPSVLHPTPRRKQVGRRRAKPQKGSRPLLRQTNRSRPSRQSTQHQSFRRSQTPWTNLPPLRGPVSPNARLTLRLVDQSFGSATVFLRRGLRGPALRRRQRLVPSHWLSHSPARPLQPPARPRTRAQSLFRRLQRSISTRSWPTFNGRPQRQPCPPNARSPRHLRRCSRAEWTSSSPW